MACRNEESLTNKFLFQVIFWGVREMKRAQLMNIKRPRADIDCCYPVVDLEGNAREFVSSPICKDASKNPNFDNPIVLFDVVSALYILGDG